jgi:hypothetical protein
VGNKKNYSLLQKIQSITVKALTVSFSIILVQIFAPFPNALAAPSLAQLFTVEGRFFLDDSPVDESVDVIFEIYSNQPANCVLYREEHTVDVHSTDPNSKGVFALPLGGGAAAQNFNGGSLVQLFSNSTNLTGEGGCTVVATNELIRYLRIKIRLSSDVNPHVAFSEGTAITTVPTAMVADTLQGLGPLDFFKTSATSTQTKLDNLLTTNYTNITDLVSGTSTNYVQNKPTGVQVPVRAGDPAAPTAGQMWYDTGTNELRYYNGTSIESVGNAGAGVTSITANAGLSGGVITSTGTIGIATNGVTSAMISDGTIAGVDIAANAITTTKLNDGSVTNAKLAGSIDASKITTGTFAAGLIPTGTDTTKLPLLGGTMGGAINMGGFDLLGSGHITMSAQKTITIGKYDNGQQTTLLGTLGMANAGATWFNSATGKLMYWNGTQSRELAETTTAGGDITSVVAGSGLTGGATTGVATLSVDIGTAAGQLFTIDSVPSCPTTQKLQMSAGPMYAWSCATEAVGKVIADADNNTKIQVEETANDDIIRFDTAGAERMVINSTGYVGIGTSAPTTFLDVTGAITSRPEGVASGQTGKFILRELAANGSNSATIRSPDALAASYVLTLPIDDGSPNQVLTTDGMGVLTWTTPSVEPSNGDKGDITVSGSGLTWTIDAGAVSLPKMANMATASILGRNTAGTGIPEVLSATTTKSLLGLNNVENTALSTWTGSTNITTLGTVNAGTWSGTAIGVTKGGTGLTSTTANQLLYSSATNTVAGLPTANNAVLITDASGSPSWITTSWDSFTQYALLAGRTGGQTLRGGTASGNNLTLDSTSHVAKGDVVIQPTGGKVGIGTTSPAKTLDVKGSVQVFDNGNDPEIRVGDNASNNIYYYWNSIGDIGAIQTFRAGTNSGVLSLNPGGGSVGIGTTSASSKLTVQGDVSASSHIVAGGNLTSSGRILSASSQITGTSISFAGKNHIVNTGPGSQNLSLSGMESGGSYTLLIADATVRTYQITGQCSGGTVHMKPAAAPSSGQTIFTIMMFTISGTDHCYVSWSTGW